MNRLTSSIKQFYKIGERKTTIPTEIIAGLVTFMTTAYQKTLFGGCFCHSGRICAWNDCSHDLCGICSGSGSWWQNRINRIYYIDVLFSDDPFHSHCHNDPQCSNCAGADHNRTSDAVDPAKPGF